MDWTFQSRFGKTCSRGKIYFSVFPYFCLLFYFQNLMPLLLIFQASLQYDEDDRSQLSWWKAKKWAITVLHKIFERLIN